MSRSRYFQELKALALKVRAENNLTSPRVLRTDMRRLYRTYGISRIDLWPPKGMSDTLTRLRGAYFNDEQGPSVMLARHLPDEPAIFTMAHELKHHLKDKHIPTLYCDASNQDEEVEVGAEVFAAELIFPDEDFAQTLRQMGIGYGQCTPERLVRLKHQTETTLSYAGLTKKAEFMRFAPAGSFAKVKWKQLDEQIYGEPTYKRVLRYRQRALSLPFSSSSV